MSTLRGRLAPIAFDSTPARHLLSQAVNRRLLTELRRDARISRAELGRRVGLSAPAVAERLARLTEAGVITGYTVDMDPEVLGYPTVVFIRLRPAPGRLSKVAEVVASTPEVVECYRITGDDCFLLKMHIPSGDRLAAVLDLFALHAGTTTSVVLATPVPRRPLPLPED